MIKKLIQVLGIKILQFNGRSCNQCVGCCYAFHVNDRGVKKKAGELCSKLDTTDTFISSATRGLCTIYKKRPKTCSKYWCLWKLGFGDKEKDWPMKSGLVFSSHPDGTVYVSELFNGKLIASKDTVDRMKTATKKKFLVKDNGEII